MLAVRFWISVGLIVQEDVFWFLAKLHFVTRRSSENTRPTSVMTNGHVANPYGLLGRAPFWAVLTGELWVRVLGVRGVWSYDSPGCGFGVGRKHIGPTQPIAGGAVGPSGSFPGSVWVGSS